MTGTEFPVEVFEVKRKPAYNKIRYNATIVKPMTMFDVTKGLLCNDDSITVDSRNESYFAWTTALQHYDLIHRKDAIQEQKQADTTVTVTISSDDLAKNVRF